MAVKPLTSAASYNRTSRSELSWEEAQANRRSFVWLALRQWIAVTLYVSLALNLLIIIVSMLSRLFARYYVVESDGSGNSMEVLSEEETLNLFTLPSLATTTTPGSFGKMEFVHITQTAGMAIAAAGARAGLSWGICHFEFLPEFGTGCNRADWGWPAKPLFVKGNPVQKGFSGELWHTPPAWLDPNRYDGTMTFTVVRDPYDRIISEYYSTYEGRGKLIKQIDELKLPSKATGVGVTEKKLDPEREHKEMRYYLQVEAARKGSDQLTELAKSSQKQNFLAKLRAQGVKLLASKQRRNQGGNLAGDSPKEALTKVFRRRLLDTTDFLRRYKDIQRDVRGDRNGEASPYSLNAWIQYVLGEGWLKNRKTAHRLPQHLYVYNGTDKIIDHVLRYELVDLQFQELMRLYEIPASLNETRINPGAYFYEHHARLTADDLDKKSISLINKLYRKDFELLGYPMRDP